MTLLEETISLLKNNIGRWPEICVKANVDYNWMSKVYYGEIQEPGVNKIERLNNVLKDLD